MWLDVYARSALPPKLALLFTATSTISLVALIALAIGRAWHHKRLAVAAETEATDLRLAEGSDCVLSGLVRHLAGRDVAVKVSITQKGSEFEDSGGWSHSWTEIDREIVVAPFLLELASGEIVRIEPPKDIEVADALDQKVWIDRNHRVLSAELVPGERIFARGRLERHVEANAGDSYRDVDWGAAWVLSSTSGNRMLLSSEPLGDRMRQRARFHRRSAWLAALALLTTQLLLLGYDARLLGHTETAVVTQHKHYETRDDDGVIDVHYTITVRDDTIEISAMDFDHVDRDSTVKLRVAAVTGAWALGEEATIAWWHAAIVSAIAFLTLMAYGVSRPGSLPRFRREVSGGESGKLPERPD